MLPHTTGGVPPLPPEQLLTPPVEEPSEERTVEPGAPVREPGPEEPQRLSDA
jgi:hypothetical protein